MVDNQVGNILRLRRHANRLSTNVHREHLGGPDPDSSTPRGLVEENEEEEQEHDRDGHGMRFGSSRKTRSLRLDCRNDQHAYRHTNTTNDEEEATAETVNSPSGVERERDSKSRIEGVDQCNGGGAFENFLVDLGGVAVERSLASDLLAGVDDKRKKETLAHGFILPQSRVGRRDGLFLELNRLADHKKFVVNLFLCVSYTGQSAASTLKFLLLDIPPRRLGNEWCLRNDEYRHK